MNWLLILLLCYDVSLIWKASPDPRTTGYVIVYGNGNGAYNHSMDVGNVTNCVVTNLVEGKCYFFACYAYATNLQSALSNQLVYDKPTQPKALKCGN